MKKRYFLQRLPDLGHVSPTLAYLGICGHGWVETRSSCHALYVIDIFIRLLVHDLIEVLYESD